jgi:predicted RNA binding protein with dsRBD fold (UPF0201 family)
LRKAPFTARIELKVEASVYPSECPEKVMSAITNVIDKCSPELRYGRRVIGRASGSESLSTIYEQVRSKASMGVLRRMLLDNKIADTTYFLLNKQAASAGVVVVIEDAKESPLGPISVTIDCEELNELICWLAPKDGK